MNDCLTGKERILYALNHKEGDRVPIFDFVYHLGLYNEILGYKPKTYNAYDVMKCAEKIGYDMGVVAFGGVAGFQSSNSSENQYTDEWGTTYQKDEAAWPIDAPVDFPLKNRDDWKKYIMPDPNIEGRTDQIKTAVKLGKESRISVGGTVRGPFTGTWLLFGYDVFCVLLYDDPELIKEVMHSVANFSIIGASRLINEGADVIFIADDFGTSSGPMISPLHFNEFVLPELRRIIIEITKKKIPVILHSDGNLNSLLKSIVNTKVSGYHPVQRTAGMEIGKIKKQYGKKICLVGNICNSTTLVSGSVEEVKAEVKECIEDASKGGGHILSSDHSLHDDIPIKNIFAVIESCKQYGKYPINIPE